MAKTDRCVVRNAANRRGNLGDRYRHNERHNQSYGNGDIDPARSALNVHYKTCEGSYTEAFDKLLADGVISTRGLGKDPKIVDELVFDVNSDYFDRHGGYEYAQDVNGAQRHQRNSKHLYA
ncbi:MAG: plasmid recombination protein [Oscillospiraceae bacterium]|nr:plasmid recombination protein [Oscillospiraceae bacterium]